MKIFFFTVTIFINSIFLKLLFSYFNFLIVYKKALFSLKVCWFMIIFSGSTLLFRIIWIFISFSIDCKAFSYNLSFRLIFSWFFDSDFFKFIDTLWSFGKSPIYKSSLNNNISIDSNLSLLLMQLFIFITLKNPLT